MVLRRLIRVIAASCALLAGAHVSPASAATRGGRALACNAAAGPCRQPDTIDVLLRPGSSELLVAANFGLLYPGGAVAPMGSWDFVCEENFGGKLAENMQFHPDGRVFVPSLEGLYYSSDGCTWMRAGGALTNTVWDIAVDPSDPSRVWALAGDVRSVYLSADGGRTFEAKHQFIDMHRFIRLQIAPSDPQVIYASGYRSRVPLILAVTTDGGATWTVNDDASKGIAGPGQTVDVERVAPNDPSTIYVSVLNAAGDEIWKIGGHGATPVKLLALPDGAEARAFTFGATPNDIYVAAKDPLEMVGKTPAFLFTSRDGGATWMPRPMGENGPRFRCLRWREGKLYACAGDTVAMDEFLLGVSSDEGATWTPVVTMRDLKGVSACVAAPCATTAAWLCESYGVCKNVVQPDGGSRPDAGPIPDASVGPPSKKGGCTFGGARREVANPAAAIAVFALLVALARRQPKGGL